MDEAEARAALATLGLHPRTVVPVLGGWANFTFDLAGELMVRFPCNAGVAESAQRELSLLPALGPTLDFAVPQPVHRGEWNGWPFFTYRKIHGRPLRADDDSLQTRRRLAEILGQLHSFPTSAAAELLGVSDDQGAWRRHYERLWPQVESVALPELDPSTAATVIAGYEQLLSANADFPKCLVHNDLFSDHVLVDGGSGRIAGIIDFEDAAIGDPLIDFVPLTEELGNEALRDLRADRDLGAGAPLRFWFYRWMSGIHHLIYGVTERADAERLSGAARVASRIVEPLLPERLFAGD